MHRHCDDYARSYRAAAGAGLPAIEPGMPEPAGTGLTRRSMMLRSLGLGVAVYGAGAVAGSERVEAAINDALGEHKVVISVFMDGGWDSLSVLPPLGHEGRLNDLRPGLTRAIDRSATAAFAEDPALYWHPSLSGLRSLYDGSDVGVAVAPAVGYSSPNYSHFTSRHFWEVGELDVGGTTGWMGRYLDRVGRPNVPLQGVSMGTALSPTLATASVPVAAIQSLSDYGYGFAGTWGSIAANAENSIRALSKKASGDPERDLARLVTGASFQLVDDLDAVKSTPQTGVVYPDANSNFVKQLKDVARLLGTRVSGSALPMRMISLRGHGGYDTHSGQNPGLSNNLKITGDAIKAFWADLKARGQDDRVLMLVWSEFGRRPAENGSGGCDHGAAGTAFVIGKDVRQQMIGEHPGLKAFGSTDSGLQQDGNVRVTSDFRGIYSAIIEQWLGTDADGIIPGAGNRPGAGAFVRPSLML